MDTKDAAAELTKAARVPSALEQLKEAAELSQTAGMSSALEQLRQAAAQAAHQMSADELRASAAKHALSSSWMKMAEDSRGLFAEFNRRRLELRSLGSVLEGVNLQRCAAPDTRLAEAAKVAGDILAARNAAFRLPALVEHARLIAQLKESPFLQQAQLTQERITSFRRAMESMTKPWLDSLDSMRSLGGLARLHEMGASLQRLSAYEDALSTRLRLDLGDWREPIDWSKVGLGSSSERRQLYLERGYRSELTEFPAETFDESLSVCGLDDPTDLDDTDGTRTFHELEHEGFVRNGRAHALLYRLETHLRRFIEDRMRQVAGEDWIRHRVHGHVRKEWEEKRAIALENGEEERSLLWYADFGQYVDIIVRNDNWQAVFAVAFKRKESVQESFRRLYPVRNCVAHNRLITADDVLYLAAESKRLLKVIRSSR